MKCHSVMTHWLLLVASTSAFAAPQSSSNQIHQPKDGVINVYGPEGQIPHYAMQPKHSPNKVA
ncbi:hypothetical protein ACOCGD_001139 [Vibrio cholerae]